MPHTDTDLRIESGRTGRLLHARLRPNMDLVTSIEALCFQHGMVHAQVRGSLGSLNQATLETRSGTRIDLLGPAVEVLTLMGEVRSEGGDTVAHLHGALTDPDGRIFAGRLVPGRAPVCITFEITLEEWLPDPEPPG